MVLESVGVLAAVAGLTGSILAATTGRLSIPVWTALVIAVCFVMLVSGRYRLLTRSALVMLVVLCFGPALADSLHELDGGVRSKRWHAGVA